MAWADSAPARKAAHLDTVFQGYDGPPFSVRLWDGWQWSTSANRQPVCTVVVGNPRTLALLLARPDEITLGEAYIRGMGGDDTMRRGK